MNRKEPNNQMPQFSIPMSISNYLVQHQPFFYAHGYSVSVNSASLVLLLTRHADDASVDCPTFDDHIDGSKPAEEFLAEIEDTFRSIDKRRAESAARVPIAETPEEKLEGLRDDLVDSLRSLIGDGEKAGYIDEALEVANVLERLIDFKINQALQVKGEK